MKIILNLFTIILFSFSYAQITHELGNFNSLEVFDKLSVELIPSKSNSIEIRGSKSESVEFIHKNNRLKIRMKIDQFLQGEDTKVIVYYTELTQIYASEGSHISSQKPVKAPGLILNAKEGAGIELEVATNSLDVKTMAGGYVFTSGSAQSQTIVSNAGGVYRGGDLKSKTTTVTVNAGGEAEIYATKYVNAKTRAGGNIHIFGGAQVDQKTTLGGSIVIH